MYSSLLIDSYKITMCDVNNRQLIFLSENNFIFKKSKLLQLHFSWCCITVNWYRFTGIVRITIGK